MAPSWDRPLPDIPPGWTPDYERVQRLVADALAQAGVTAEVRITPDPARDPRPPMPAERGHWLTDLWLISIVVGQPLAWFFGGFFQEAGKDAYVRLKRLRERAAHAPSAVAQAVGEVQIRSAAGGPAVALGSAFPYDDETEDAVDALRRLDWDRFESGGVLRWSPERRAWSLEDD